MFTQNFTKLSAAVHELSCWQTFLPSLAVVKKNPEIWSWTGCQSRSPPKSCTLSLRPRYMFVPEA